MYQEVILDCKRLGQFDVVRARPPLSSPQSSAALVAGRDRPVCVCVCVCLCVCVCVRARVSE